MNAWLERMRDLWCRIFFWQGPNRPSAEFKPTHEEERALLIAVTEPKPVPRWRQLRFVGRVLPKTERQIFWSALIVCTLSVVVGVGDIGRRYISEVPAEGGTVTEALIGTPKLINPLYASLNDVDRDLVTLVYSGLFRLDEKLEAIPDLAERYRWTDDGRTLEVSLREGLRFHDGQKLTVDDVIFTYLAIKDPAWRSPLAPFFRDVKNVIRVDDVTVQFQLERPDPNFILNLNIGILPTHIWGDIPAGSAQLANANIRPIGSGPYKVASFTRDGRGTIAGYHFVKFNGYHGLKPYIQDWRFKFFPDRTSAAAALKSNQADALAFVPWSEANDMRGDQYHPVSLELPQKTVAFFNVKDNLLKDEEVRRALTMAVDPSELPEILDGRAMLATSPFPFLSAATGTVPDLEASRALLDKLGWKTVEGSSIRMKGAAPSGTQLSITIDLPNQPDLLKVAEFLRRRWSLIGAQVEVRGQDAESFIRESLPNRAYQVIIWNVLYPPSQDMAPLWSSSQTTGRGLNFSNISDRNIDQALTEIANATSTEAQTVARQNFTNAVSARHPALFLVQPSHAYLVSKQIKGVESVRIGRPADRFFASMKWYVNTKWTWQ